MFWYRYQSYFAILMHNVLKKYLNWLVFFNASYLYIYMYAYVYFLRFFK